jgi:tetratricopeptide (TPR) repeat protein
MIPYETAEAAFFEGRYADALELFTAYTNQNPENAWGHFMLGLSSWKAGDPETAEEVFREGLLLDPDHLKTLVNLGRVLMDQEKPEEALVPLQRAVELAPQNADAYRVLGRAYHNLQRSQEAEQAYKETLRRNDQDFWAWNNLGLLYIEAGDFEEALPLLARATFLNENIACFQNNLGMALERTGHFQAAALAYEKAISLAADYEKAAVNLARVEDLPDAPGVEQIDLKALAQEFKLDPPEAKETVTELADSGPAVTSAEGAEEDQ